MVPIPQKLYPLSAQTLTFNVESTDLKVHPFSRFKGNFSPTGIFLKCESILKWFPITKSFIKKTFARPGDVGALQHVKIAACMRSFR